MTAGRTDLLQGTLELLVLRTLALEPMHGWGLAQRIETMSGQVFEIQQGTLYPALQRMKRKGWVRSEWRQTENNRRARYYAITATGRRQLEKEREQWARTAAGVAGVLEWKGGPA
ncbi:MAG: PadR family transcriptional regulator [Vicinamibacterales bacterium]|jgi:transcriptional regulator|nr:PadR family transcriptional regulator [Vicinamibacterales bacterium]